MKIATRTSSVRKRLKDGITAAAAVASVLKRLVNAPTPSPLRKVMAWNLSRALMVSSTGSGVSTVMISSHMARVSSRREYHDGFSSSNAVQKTDTRSKGPSSSTVSSAADRLEK